MALDDEKRLSSSNQDGISISRQLPVMGQQVHRFNTALCNKQAVERIAMMLGECPDFEGMAESDWQFLEAALRDGCDDQRWGDLNLAEAGLDSNFPD